MSLHTNLGAVFARRCWKGPQLPWSLLLLYFVNSCVSSFPMTAYNDFLNNELKMSPATIARYQSFCFAAWVLKPLYGWIVNTYSIFGENRRPYIFLAGLCSAASYVMTAIYIRSIPAIFMVGMFKSACEAFSELVLDMVLIDFACARVKAGRAKANRIIDTASDIELDQNNDQTEAISVLQSLSTGARFTGTLFALLIGLPVYGCSNRLAFDNRLLLGINAAFPLIGVVASYFIPSVNEDENRNESPPAAEVVSENRMIGTSTGINFVVGMTLLLLLLVWTSLRSTILSSRSFLSGSFSWEVIEILMLVSLVVFAGRIILIDFKTLRAARDRAEAEHLISGDEIYPDLKIIFHVLIPVIFLLLVNITSSLDSPWSSYYYSLFESHQNCKIQVMSVVSSVANLLACFVYAKYLSVVNFPIVLGATLLVSAVLPLLRLPAIIGDAGANHVNATSNTELHVEPCNKVFGLDPFTYITCIGFFTAFAGRLAFLSLQVLATRSSCAIESVKNVEKVESATASDDQVHRAVRENWSSVGMDDSGSTDYVSMHQHQRPGWLSAGFVYSLYLSCIDYADTASGWLNAPIIEKLNISRGNWDGLYLLTIIASISKAIMITFIPLVKLSQENLKFEEPVETQDHDNDRNGNTGNIYLMPSEGAYTSLVSD